MARCQESSRTCSPAEDRFGSNHRNSESRIVPRGAHNDGGRSTAAAGKAEAANDQLLLLTRVRLTVVSELEKAGITRHVKPEGDERK